MPTYEYECESCKKKHEEFQSITATALTTCPHCKGRLRRLMGGGAGFIFKGSGFYITDYRSKSYKEGKKKDKADSTAKTTDSSSSSSDSSSSSSSSSTSTSGESSKKSSTSVKKESSKDTSSS